MSDKTKTSDTDNLTLKDFMPDASKGYIAIAGTKLEGKSDKADEIQIINALMKVKDPEIPVNIYDLGLIYSIERHRGGDVDITMSLTAPGCPVAGEMPGQVAKKVAEL
ncbi:MAG: iron-sulfur cluster assembly protein, partial [Alphaproteobacteria bacterium]